VCELHIATNAMPCLYGPSHKVHVLFESQRRVPVLSSPCIVSFSDDYIATPIQSAVPLQAYDSIAKSADLYRDTLWEVITC
jgi:hypothetical protein